MRELESRLLLSTVYWTGEPGAPETFSDETLWNTTIEVPAGAHLHLGGNLTLENCTLVVDSGATVSWDGGLLTLAGSTWFTNNGKVDWRADMTVERGANFDNEGTFTWKSGVLTNYFSFVNGVFGSGEAVMNWDGGAVENYCWFANWQVLNWNAGTLSVNLWPEQNNMGWFDNEGLCNWNGGHLIVDGVFNNPGTLNWNGGTADLNLVAYNDGTLNVNGGAIDVNPGARFVIYINWAAEDALPPEGPGPAVTVNINGGSFILHDGAVLDNHGIINVRADPNANDHGAGNPPDEGNRPPVDGGPGRPHDDAGEWVSTAGQRPAPALPPSLRTIVTRQTDSNERRGGRGFEAARPERNAPAMRDANVTAASSGEMSSPTATPPHHIGVEPIRPLTTMEETPPTGAKAPVAASGTPAPMFVVIALLAGESANKKHRG